MSTREILVGRLRVYLPEGATGPVGLVLVCPGGGYARLADHEGEPVARWALSCGFAAAVVSYRVAPEAGFPNSLEDLKEAVREVRRRKGEWNLTGKIAVLGFSAGGHAAASLSVHGCHDPETRVEGSVLVYPVISMKTGVTHEGSRANLLGGSPSAEMIEKTSCEMQVTGKTPPAFLVHGVNDDAVPVENAMLYASALRAKGVSFELHVYPDGPHGFGMGLDRGPIGEWSRLAGVWLRSVI